MGKYKDVSPVAGAKSGGGKKNVDGREMGAAWNSNESDKVNAKETYNPNEGAPKLGQRPGLED